MPRGRQELPGRARRLGPAPLRRKMTPTITLPHRLQALLLACAAAIALAPGAQPAQAQTVAVMVNGEPITDFDIAQRSKLDALTAHKQPSRQEAINELIDDKVKIKEAKKYGVDPGASDVDEAYAQMASRMRVEPDQLSKSLESQGIRPDTLKLRIKADLVWTSLVRGRYKERLQVGDQDVEAALRAETGEEPQEKTDAFEYRLQPVVLLVPKGAPPAVMETKHKEAESLRAKLQTCEEANAFFKSMPNAAIHDSIVKTSADIPPELRKVLDDTPVGHLTPPEITKQGVEMVALCGRKPTTVDTPKKKEIREKLYAQRYQTTSNTYLQEIRREAMIEYRR